MSNKLKKIKVSELQPGMFIHAMDISWLQNPFLRSRRKITCTNDILLLQKAGAKIVSIDLDKGFDIVEVSTEEEKTAPQQKTDVKTDIKESKTVSLAEELHAAKNIKNKIFKLIDEINKNIKNGLSVNSKDILPIINETLESLHRNDQALLSLLHVYRKDRRLSAHGFAVFSLVLMLAIKTHCDQKQTEILAMSALLHDCGWTRLPMNLIGKAKNYSVSEQKLVKQHVQLASHALKKSKSIDQEIIQLIEQHHELSNGKGYPQQIGKEDFHPLHNHLQLVDLYDTYLHGLEDNPAIVAVNALKKLYHDSQKGYFTQELVTELIQILGVYPIGSIVQLTSDEVASVVEINRKLPLLPKVKLLLNKKQEIIAINEQIIIDLADDKSHRLVIKVLNPSRLPNTLT